MSKQSITSLVISRRDAVTMMGSAITLNLLGGERAFAFSTTDLWGNTGWDATPTYVTTATTQSLSDFVYINPVTYTLRTVNTSSGLYETFSLAAYYMGKYQVTNANWKAYCNANSITSFPTYWSSGSYPSGKANHPVFFISYTQAVAYCAWLSTQISGYTFFIPSEAEWEWAALGTSAGTALSSGYYRSVNNGTYVYPWGTTAGITYSSGTLTTRFNCNAVCAALMMNSGMTTLTYYNDTSVSSGGGYVSSTDSAPLTTAVAISGSGGVTGWTTSGTTATFVPSDQFKRLVNTWGGNTSAVGSYSTGVSSLGLYDMAGNAYEWTSSTGIATNGVENGQLVNIVRGGSWYSTSNSGSCISRVEGRTPSGGYHSVGFRVACRPG